MNTARLPAQNSRMRELLRELKSREKDMVRLLGEFVRCESPSHDKSAVDRFGHVVAREWRKRGAKVRMLHQAEREIMCDAKPGWAKAAPSSGQIMVLGHLDTVYRLGTLAKMPFRISGGRAWGPGTFDA